MRRQCARQRQRQRGGHVGTAIGRVTTETGAMRCVGVAEERSQQGAVSGGSCSGMARTSALESNCVAPPGTRWLCAAADGTGGDGADGDETGAALRPLPSGRCGCSAAAVAVAMRRVGR
jgi:hypothetical protein